MVIVKNPTETKAKKQHKCNFCNKEIIAGVKYMSSENCKYFDPVSQN